MSKKIVIASVLKPVDDVRSYWKIAQSLAKTNKYDVNIIGNAGKKGNDDKNIHFHPHKIKRSHWLKRLLIRERILFKILQIKPSLLIITTYELINVAIIAKCLTGCKLVYDVQENYSLNILLNKTFSRKIYSWLVKFQEWIGSIIIDHFWLAEACYQSELKFVRSNFSIVENKAIEYPLSDRKHEPIRMLFSGTVSSYAGADIAIKLMIKLAKIHTNSFGCIIGQIHDKELRKYLEDQASNYPNIQLELSTEPVPYDQILDRISQANLGIISYLENDVNRNKIPTKLYEYSRYQLPYLIQKETLWSKKGNHLGGAIPIDLNDPSLAEIEKSLKNQWNLFPATYPKEATWEFESETISSSIDKLISGK